LFQHQSIEREICGNTCCDTLFVPSLAYWKFLKTEQCSPYWLAWKLLTRSFHDTFLLHTERFWYFAWQAVAIIIKPEMLSVKDAN